MCNTVLRISYANGKEPVTLLELGKEENAQEKILEVAARPNVVKVETFTRTSTFQQKVIWETLEHGEQA